MFVFFIFFFNDTATTEIYTLSLHDALPIYVSAYRTCNIQKERVNPDYFFQKAGDKMMSTVNNSSLPSSIRKDKNHLPKSGKNE